MDEAALGGGLHASFINPKHFLWGKYQDYKVPFGYSYIMVKKPFPSHS